MSCLAHLFAFTRLQATSARRVVPALPQPPSPLAHPLAWILSRLSLRSTSFSRSLLLPITVGSIARSPTTRFPSASMSLTQTRPETAFAPLPEAQRGFQLKGLTKA